MEESEEERGQACHGLSLSSVTTGKQSRAEGAYGSGAVWLGLLASLPVPRAVGKDVEEQA